MTMASAEAITTDLTTCPICLEIFDNPKSLPCLHAFCLKCLEKSFENAYPGDEVPCPVCRKEFQIPPDGLGGLQHHFFVQRLVDFRRASSKEFEEVPCEVCLEENEGDSASVPTATTYCVDCSQKLCDQCSRPHRRMPGGAHQVKHLGAEVEQELIQLRGSACDKHKDKQVELYCCDCNENICLMCSAVKHKSHSSCEIPEMAGNFRVTIGTDGELIQSALTAVREESRLTKQGANEFLNKAEDIRKMVIETGDAVKRSVDDQITDVLTGLKSVTSEGVKQAESLQERYQLAIVSMESFRTYSRELLDKGRPCDITRAACKMHERAKELLNNDVTAVQYRPPHVSFTPADVTKVKSLNLIGKLTTSTDNRPELSSVSSHLLETEQDSETAQQLKEANDKIASLEDQLECRELQLHLLAVEMKEFEMKGRNMGSVIQRLPEGKPVMGVTSLENHVYLLRANKSTDQIEVYDTESYRLQHCLTVPGFDSAGDILACEHNHCAYVSDVSQMCMHRLALAESDAITKWPVGDLPTRLSHSDSHGVLVTCTLVRKIKEFSTDGELLREVVLPDDVLSPWLAVQVFTGFRVCHGAVNDPVHRVCLVSSDGSVAKSYGGPKGGGTQQLDVPMHMAVDDMGFVFVADVNNCRVVLLSPSLQYIREVGSLKQLQMYPCTLHVDSQRHRLYIAANESKDGKYTSGRVFVIGV